MGFLEAANIYRVWFKEGQRFLSKMISADFHNTNTPAR